MEAESFKKAHGSKSPGTLDGASDMHKLAIRLLNQMGGKIDFESFPFLLELHGVDDPETLYYVMQAVLEGHHDNNPR